MASPRGEPPGPGKGPSRFSGRTYFLTGGASGIGKALAATLLSEGARVALFDRDPEALSRARRDLEPWGPGRTLDLPGNVTEVAQVEEGVTRAARELGPLSGAVCCAGIVRDRTLLKMTDEEWHQVLDVNLTGTFHVFRAVARVLKEQGHGGRLLAVSSIVGLRGAYGQANYAASKAGLLGLVSSAARELGRFGITVNAVAPGYVRTPLTAALGETLLEYSRTESPLGRVAEPEDVARVMAFLLSDDARHITGECVRVDGGQAI